MKTFKEFRTGVISEAPVDGVAKGSLPNDDHMCATKIFHKEWNEGTPIFGEHAEPVDGKVAWYKVMFEHGIEQVEVDDPNVEVLEEGSHGSHKKVKSK
tara:strand:- start:888 stop:1181 length:294 start_codon:yes stop_codon:yes gene_type:complete